MKLLLALIPLLFTTTQASAQEVVGQREFQSIVNLFSSPFGLAIGLLVTTWGLWTFVVGQKVGRGLILIILGVVVSIFPSVYNAIRKDFYSIPASIGGSGNASDFSTYLNTP